MGLIKAPQYVHTAKGIIKLDDNLKQNFVAAVNKMSEYIVSENHNNSTNHRPGGGRRIADF